MAGQSGAEKGASAAGFPPALTYSVLALLMGYGFVRSLVAAAGKPFWYDELLTGVVAAQGTWDRIIAALRGPTDGQPPVFYVVEDLASGLCANQQVALRLPAALGLVCALLCIFVFARKRCGDLIALLCAGGLFVSCIFQTYAQEARPYSLVIALIAFAMVCYQRAESARWLLLLGASLALAEALHYLAVLAMAPFGAAELCLTISRKKVRWGVWAALAAGLILLAFGYFAAQGSRQATVVAATFVLAAIGISELHFWRFQGTERRAVAERGAKTARFFESAGYRELPVVVPNGSTLLATVYYAFPDRAQRFVYLQAERAANDPDQSDTTDKGLQQVSKYWPIQVETAQAFLAEHAGFLVYTEGPDVGKDRVSSARLEAGWSVRVVAFDGFRALYLVSREREN